MGNRQWLRVVACAAAVNLVGCAMRTPPRPAVPGGAWVRVRTLAERTTIYVTLDGGAESRRWFVSATDATLVVRDLRIRSQPETIPRSRVVQVRAPRPRSAWRAAVGMFLGGFGGGLLGGLIGGALAGDAGGIRGLFSGTLGGMVVGGIVGANGGWRQPYDVIYIRR